jgi:hypothetical protein
MSEPDALLAAEPAQTPTPTQPPEPAPTLSEAVRAKLKEAAAPLTLKEILKGLPKPGKKEPKLDVAVPELLANDLQQGSIFKSNSGSKGAERFWNRDEKLAIRDAVLLAAATPKSLPALKKLAKDATKADKAFAEPIVDEMVQAGQLHKQSEAGSAPYGVEKPREVNNKDEVSQAILKYAQEPQAKSALVTMTVGGTGATKKFVEATLAELIQDKKLFPYAAGANGPYGTVNPNDKERVSAAILRLAETPANRANLIKGTVAETKADKDFVESIVAELIQEKKLHPQSPAAKPLYGTKPVDPLSIEPAKKAFAAFVKAGEKLIEAASGVSLDVILQRFRDALGKPDAGQQPTPAQPHGQHEQTTGKETHPPKPRDEAHPHPEPKPHPVIPPPPGPEALTPDNIQAGLKSAYDELCLEVEFQDKVVEMRRLYHEAVRNMPGLSVAQFHRELLHLERDRKLELQALNEVQRAQEPQLAIHRDDRLLYYVLWR